MMKKQSVQVIRRGVRIVGAELQSLYFQGF